MLAACAQRKKYDLIVFMSVGADFLAFDEKVAWRETRDEYKAEVAALCHPCQTACA